MKNKYLYTVYRYHTEFHVTYYPVNLKLTLINKFNKKLIIL